MAALEIFLFPVRIVQGIFAIIVLGTLAFTANAWDGDYFVYSTPSEISFLLFCSVWTLLALAYLILSPMFFPVAAHRFAVLAVEAVTMIFWFAGFIALAVPLGGDNYAQRYTSFRTAAAGDAFSAFEWVLFVFTTVVAALAAAEGRRTRKAPVGPAMQVP